NAARIKVTIGAPAGLAPDKYEDNNTALAAIAKNLGGPYSPNLGPCAPLRTIEDLSVSDYQDVDYFRFFMNSTAGSNDFLRIDFRHADGDLDLELFNDSQVRLFRANGVADSEVIALEGYPAGWYYARVYGYNGAINPEYSLTIDPPSNAAPSVTALAPASEDTLVHGLEMFQVVWEFSDPEGDSCWALVYANTVPAFDGAETLVSRSGYVPAALGGYMVNSAHLQVATYWFYVLVTDGGSVSGAWSDGTVTFSSSLSCPAGDANGSGSIDIGDVTFLVDFIFRGGPQPELSAGDANADATVNIADITYLLARIFANGPAPVCP
ncbi:MAG TPA: dockerin type I repeat-containing protein, partial [candidate division Zixibacteria bacterium]|nr:dockerin type I repeat-containing protein [candidate division Zixibacteria bacterium]